MLMLKVRWLFPLCFARPRGADCFAWTWVPVGCTEAHNGQLLQFHWHFTSSASPDVSLQLHPSIHPKLLQDW